MAHSRAHTRVQSAKQEQRVDHFFIRPNDSYCVQSSAQFDTCSVGTQKSVYSLSTSEIPTLLILGMDYAPIRFTARCHSPFTIDCNRLPFASITLTCTVIVCSNHCKRRSTSATLGSAQLTHTYDRYTFQSAIPHISSGLRRSSYANHVRNTVPYASTPYLYFTGQDPDINQLHLSAVLSSSMCTE